MCHLDRRRFVLGTAAIVLAGPAAAQETFPSRPVTIINAFPPGGANDIVTRPLAAAMETVLKQPAISVKIENTEQARPQTNLEFADVVFEENVEYGISRLIAVYQSDYPKEVGPIRSMRPMDKNIIGQFGGPLVFSGAQRRFINAAAASGS